MIAGHGERLPSESLLAPVHAENKDQVVTFERVWQEAVAGVSLVPAQLSDKAAIEQADGVLLLQADRSYSDEDLRALDRLVVAGKPLVVLAGAANIKRGDPTMSASLDTHGLEKLLAGYGIEMGSDVVLDWEHAMTVTAQGPSGVAQHVLPQLLFLIDDRRHAEAPVLSFLGFGRLALPLASSLTLHPEKQRAAHLVTIARTGPHADLVTQSDASLSPFVGTELRSIPPAADGKTFVLGAYVEGPLVSAFAEPGEKAGKNGTRGRVLVLASPFLLANPLAIAASGDAPSPPAIVLEQLSARYIEEALEPMVYGVKHILDWTELEPELLSCGEARP